MYTQEQLEMFTDMPFLVFVKDEELNYVWGNKYFINLLGFESLDELVGKSDSELMWSDYADTLNDNDREALNSGKPVNIVESSVIPGRGRVGGHVCKFPVVLDGKKFLMGIALLVDE